MCVIVETILQMTMGWECEWETRPTREQSSGPSQKVSLNEGQHMDTLGGDQGERERERAHLTIS